MSAIGTLLAKNTMGIKPGLERMREACAAMGHPELALGRVVHVAGTNGKGQVCATVDAALRARGCRVCRYTSPHLVRVNERFFLGGEMVSDADLERAAAKVLPFADRLTYFEALTLAAFVLFAEFRPDFTILETGLGGRLDATNVCRPEVAAITKIGLDHCDWLGDTVEEIAREKAGIFKPGAITILGPNSAEVRKTVNARINVESNGDFVAQNRATALAILAALCVAGWSEATLPSAEWPGRLQDRGRFIIDGAHNPPGAAALVDALRRRLPGEKFNLVYGACADKDVDAVLEALAPIVASGYAVAIGNPRALPPAAICAKMRAAGIPAREWSLDRLEELEGRVLVCGSLFLAGEALVKLRMYPWTADRFDPEEGVGNG